MEKPRPIFPLSTVYQHFCFLRRQRYNHRANHVINIMLQIKNDMLQDYVTKREFGDFKDEMREFRCEVDTRFDRVESRLDKVETRLGNVESRLGNVETSVATIERNAATYKQEITESFNRTAGMILDQMKYDFCLAVEYLEHVVRNDDNREVEKRFRKVFYNKK